MLILTLDLLKSLSTVRIRALQFGYRKKVRRSGGERGVSHLLLLYMVALRSDFKFLYTCKDRNDSCVVNSYSQQAGLRLVEISHTGPQGAGATFYRP